MPARRAHYVLSSHWDREWYQSFQDYRYRLVQLLDRVITAEQDGRLKGPFQTDGQAIVLDDYLEIRPEKRAVVEQLVREGKLVVGPWYVLPDEFLVSGESLVRNIRLGRQIVREYGAEPSNSGWVCDLFGHCGQMPQILANFSIKFGFVWRGINAIDLRLIKWIGVDGTQIPCFRFGHRGYCSYSDKVREAFDLWNFPSDAKVAANLQHYLKEEDAITPVGPLLLFDGGDHQEWDQPAYRAIADRHGKSVDGFEVVHSSLDAYIAEMLPHASKFKHVIKGEMREPGRHPIDKDEQWVIPGVLSSRIWIKQQNAACETALCAWAEPFNVLSNAAVDLPYPQGFLDVAWKLLLQNHPHDSICGCSIDDTHKDMEHRFRQSKQIADRITLESMTRISANIQGPLSDGEIRLTVFNPMPHAVEGIQEITLQIPSEWPGFQEFFGFENKPAFRIFSEAGEEVPYQRLAQVQNRIKAQFADAKMPGPIRVHDVAVALPISIPATGYSTLILRKGTSGIPTRHSAPNTRPSLITSGTILENEFLAGFMGPSDIGVQDKRTGQMLEGLLAFEDVADIGDGWFHGIPVNDQEFTSLGAKSSISIVHDGPFQATIRRRTVMQIPAEFDFTTMSRSSTFVDLVIDSFITLRAGSDRIEVVTKIHNTARDHRLRVIFPSGNNEATTFLADNVFDVVERPIALRKDNHLYRELEVEPKPQQSWTGIFDPLLGIGLAIVSAGQYEACVRDREERPIALTLYRSFRKTVFTDGEPDGQLLNHDLTFKYWIVPIEGGPDLARLSNLGIQIAAGIKAVQTRPVDQQRIADPNIKLPATSGLYEVGRDVVVTSARLVGDALEIRLFNPSKDAAKTTLKLNSPEWVKAVSFDRVDFESNVVMKGGTVKKGKIPLTVEGKKIVTLRISR